MPVSSGAMVRIAATFGGPVAAATRSSGKPRYPFSVDRAAAYLNVDNQSDSFDGTNFTWHAATGGY